MLSRLFYEFRNKLKEEKTKYQDDIWHYTSSVGLKNIIENDCLWFSDRRFLNDKTECNYIYSLISELFKKKYFKNFNKEFAKWLAIILEQFNTEDMDCERSDKILMPCYVASFSMSKDNLGLWNYYTKNQHHVGYAIRTKAKDLLELMERTSFLNKYSYTNGVVIYSKSIQIKLLKDLLEAYNNLYIKFKSKNKNFKEELFIFELVNLLDLYNLFFKPDAYRAEQEYRFVLVDLNFANHKYNDIKFRIYNDIFIPYVELKNIRNSIYEIMISPATNQKLLRNSTEILTNNYKLNKLYISTSKIPSRY